MIFSSGIRITQYFGENPEVYRRFGLLGHDGIDVVPLSEHDDWSVHAYISGIVVEKYMSETYGNTVITYNARHRIAVRYAHLSKVAVHLGQYIHQDKVIGVMGNTGNSTGAHLHTHIVPCSPYSNKLFTNNGYKGRMDPLPLLIFDGAI